MNGLSRRKLLTASALASLSIYPREGRGQIFSFFTNNGASLYLGQVATRTLIPNFQDGTAFIKNLMTRRWHFARDTITSLQLVIPNFAITGGPPFIEKTAPGTTTITASIEYPAGTFTQVKFSGSSSASIATPYIVSDAVSVSIPNGAVFYTRIYIVNTSGLSYSSWALGSAGQPGISTGDNLNWNTGTDQTMSGSITNNVAWIGTTHFGPLAIIAQTRQPSVFLLGDSRVFGERDIYDSSGDLGELARSIGPYFGYVNVGVSSDEAQWFIASHTSRLAIASYCSHVILQSGVNDIAIGNRTAAQLAADRQTILGLFTGKPVFETTLVTETTSTDNWATTANQTPSGNASVRQAFNTSVRAGTSGMAGYFDPVTQTETSLSSSIWNANGTAFKYTLEGVHETQFTNLLIQSAGVINPAFFHRP